MQPVLRMAHFNDLWKCLTLLFVGICFFQLAAGQKFTFKPFEYDNECGTVRITFEVVVAYKFGTSWIRFSFNYEAVRGTVVS